eukprot:scaffold1603_cov415-Prasinococcus_capsulatus_cf.AAC.8
MIAGMWMCNKYASMTYDWVGLREIRSTGGKVGRILKQFYIPYSWTNYQWEAFRSPKRLLQVLWALCLLSLAELNAFFLKFILYVPAPNALNIYRLFLLWLMNFPAVREYYAYIEGRSNRLGANLWLIGMIVAVELLLAIKFSIQDPGAYSAAERVAQSAGRELPPHIPAVSTIRKAWAVFAIGFGCWAFVHFNVCPRIKEGSRWDGVLSAVSGCLFFSSLAPLVALCCIDAAATFQF